MIQRIIPPSVLASLALLNISAPAGEAPPPEPVPDEAQVSWWEEVNDWTIAGILYPGLHLNGAGGWSTTDPADLAEGGHDPNRESFSAQAIEPTLSLRTEYVEGFANYLFFQDEGGDWDGEWEEGFLKLPKLPFGFSLRGGQFLNRFGQLNNRHLHAWDFVDSEMVLSRFLGEDGLATRGGELSWELPLGMDPVWTVILTGSYGEARTHDHAHGHGDDHGHGEEAAFEGEEGVIEGHFGAARGAVRYRLNDFHQLTGGLSWAGGDNGLGRTTHVAGADFEYLWRENGLEPGGRALRWRNEFLWREVGAASGGHGHEEHGHEEHGHDDHGEEDHEHEDEHEHEEGSMRGTFNEAGFYSHLIYTWHPRVDTGLRVGWVEGIDAFGLEDRWRVSPNISLWADDGRRAGLRLQYNYDRIGGEDEHGVWLQVNINLGSQEEVR